LCGVIVVIVIISRTITVREIDIGIVIVAGVVCGCLWMWTSSMTAFLFDIRLHIPRISTKNGATNHKYHSQLN
jgi:hypothetical protein